MHPTHTCSLSLSLTHTHSHTTHTHTYPPTHTHPHTHTHTHTHTCTRVHTHTCSHMAIYFKPSYVVASILPFPLPHSLPPSCCHSDTCHSHTQGIGDNQEETQATSTRTLSHTLMYLEAMVSLCQHHHQQLCYSLVGQCLHHWPPPPPLPL